ncbi:Retrovirus-related Pol polyprotein from transposon opus [Gossypium australe]|uniref:Retrovirus-related Pol polyprotein from transposon opus n=1 Tax=Gossypium australe TaxID=47621 RepID=A0A5B6W637_9ROSI|nr:Retrovirus-related Pol polyprotein from transposon opus [Gossypium australe]
MKKIEVIYSGIVIPRPFRLSTSRLLRETRYPNLDIVKFSFSFPSLFECSVVVSRRVPPKLKDPNSFTIPIEIEGVNFGKVLCYLGESIKLMPLSIYRRIEP